VAEVGLEGMEVVSFLRPPFLQRLAIGDLVNIVAALAEHGIDAELLMAPLQTRVIVSGPALAAVAPAQLLRLAKAASSSQVLADCAIGPVAGAAANALARWPVESVAELLLVVATADGISKPVATTPGSKKLFARVEEFLAPLLESKNLELPVLLKVVIGAGAAAGQCRRVLDIAARRAIVHVHDMRLDQAMLLTQGVLPLGGSHPVVVELLNYWTQTMANPKGGIASIPEPDDIAQLAMLAAMVAPNFTNLFYVIGIRLQETRAKLTEAGRGTLAAAFPGGGGPDFPGKEQLLAILAEKAPPPGDSSTGAAASARNRCLSQSRSRSRSRSR